ncbi:hypothetical protein BY458DRAFT_487076 [Sporodiniella umbellata]|nr:hypothetical protein BY458DRAFT_487076 [Sporodiniella umbellata]
MTARIESRGWIPAAFFDTSADPSQKRPGGLVENDHKIISFQGYYRQIQLEYVIQVMAVGNPAVIKIALFIRSLFFLEANVLFSISKTINDMLMVLELDCVHFPSSLGEFSQLVSYFDQPYNVVSQYDLKIVYYIVIV